MRIVDKILDLYRPVTKPSLVCVDNVAQYYFEGISQETFNWEKDFPNIAPPWPTVLYFMTVPRSVAGHKGQEYAILVSSNESDGFANEMWANSLRESFGQEIEPAIQHALPRAKWISEVVIFTPSSSAYAYRPLAHTVLFIDPAGRYLRPTPSRMHIWRHNSHLPDLAVEALEHVVGPVLLAISFLHCKNTVIEDVCPPPKLAKRTMQRHGVPLNTYKVLNIQPVAAVLAAAGKGESLVKRLHICRGHFKDYRQRGVFGKAKGLFWWGQHVRGNKDLGMVTKEYAVHSPESAR